MQDRIIVALDHPDAASALTCARALAGRARWLKVGMTLFYAEGPEIVAHCVTWASTCSSTSSCTTSRTRSRARRARSARSARTCSRCTRRGADDGGGRGRAVRARAPRSAGSRPAVIAVTVLTSMDDDALAVDRGARLARPTRSSAWPRWRGTPACTASCARRRRPARCGAARARGARRDARDPARVGAGRRPGARRHAGRAPSPQGASHLVIGRPITAAYDPVAAFERIVTEG